jgi:hypothetical protein
VPCVENPSRLLFLLHLHNTCFPRVSSVKPRIGISRAPVFVPVFAKFPFCSKKSVFCAQRVLQVGQGSTIIAPLCPGSHSVDTSILSFFDQKETKL